jgi:tRNA uridine 5-carbamoylmethylation protein Kti12
VSKGADAEGGRRHLLRGAPMWAGRSLQSARLGRSVRLVLRGTFVMSLCCRKFQNHRKKFCLHCGSRCCRLGFMVYDFSSLTYRDFEDMVGDLLQAELGVMLERFAAGRDAGIDLRYSRSPNGFLIVQCKHFAASGLSKLVSHLRNEVTKVRKLSPQRYILATSVRLSPNNKDAIVDLFSPYIHSPQDIYGADDLNNLLKKFPSIELRNFKLYLTSLAVLNRAVNSEIFARSESVLSDARRKARLYVPSSKHLVAKQTLEEQHMCVLSGIPGVGKTTLAEMLILECSRCGWSVVFVSSDISEADRVYDEESKQIFFYDDFLGQIGISERLDKNEDERLVRFISRVANAPNKRLVLTTREYILEYARQLYEKLNRLAINKRKCVIELADYKLADCGKILYNHLYFSSMQIEWKRELVEKRLYRKIIRHPNYNPRLIESVIEIASEDAASASDFFNSMFRALDNPKNIWRYPFERQLSIEARKLLLSISSVPVEIEIEDLKLIYTALVRKPPEETILDFRDTIKMLEKTFTRTDFVSNMYIVKLCNPSIRDFLINYLGECSEYIVIILSSAPFFLQVRMLWQYSQEFLRDDQKNKIPKYAALREALLRYRCELLAALKRTFYGPTCQINTIQYYADGAIKKFKAGFSLEERLLYIWSVADFLGQNIQETWLRETVDFIVKNWDGGVGEKNCCVRLLEKVAELKNVWNNVEISEFKAKAKLLILSSLFEETSDFDVLLDFHIKFPGLLTDKETDVVRQRFFDWMESQGTDALFYEESDLFPEAFEWIKNTAAHLSVKLDPDFVDKAEQRIASYQASEHVREISANISGSSRVAAQILSKTEDREIDSIFETLVEGL